MAAMVITEPNQHDIRLPTRFQKSLRRFSTHETSNDPFVEQRRHRPLLIQRSLPALAIVVAQYLTRLVLQQVHAGVEPLPKCEAFLIGLMFLGRVTQRFLKKTGIAL